MRIPCRRPRPEPPERRLGSHKSRRRLKPPLRLGFRREPRPPHPGNLSEKIQPLLSAGGYEDVLPTGGGSFGGHTTLAMMSWVPTLAISEGNRGRVVGKRCLVDERKQHGVGFVVWVARQLITTDRPPGRSRSVVAGCSLLGILQTAKALGRGRSDLAPLLGFRVFPSGTASSYRHLFLL